MLLNTVETWNSVLTEVTTGPKQFSKHHMCHTVSTQSHHISVLDSIVPRLLTRLETCPEWVPWQFQNWLLTSNLSENCQHFFKCWMSKSLCDLVSAFLQSFSIFSRFVLVLSRSCLILVSVFLHSQLRVTLDSIEEHMPSKVG